MNSEPQPSIKVHIDELVLHGFEPGERQGIAAALETELARLMGEGGWPGKGGLARLNGKPLNLGRLNGGAFRVTPGAKPQAAGAEIARAVFRSVQRGTRAASRAVRTR